MANRFPIVTSAAGFPVRDNTVGGSLGSDDESFGLPEGSFAPTSRPSGGLSYDADIAPLEKNFFKDVEGSSLSDAQKNALVFGMADNMEKIRSMRQKSEMQEQQMRLRDLQYRSTLASMDDDRKKKQTDYKINHEQLPQATAELDSFIDDPAMDNNQKKEAIARWGIKNAPLLSKSPGARYAHQSAQDWVSANDTKKNPAAFAAKIAQLGLDPYSPEVAKMPGATPLGLQLAQQAEKRKTEKAVSAARTTAASKKETDETARVNKRLDRWHTRKLDEPSTDSGELFIGGDGYYYDSERKANAGDEKDRKGHPDKLTPESERDMHDILAMSATGEETDKKKEIERDWGSLSDVLLDHKYGTIRKKSAQMELADRIATRMRNARADAGRGITSTAHAFLVDEEEEEENKIDALEKKIEELTARLAAAGK
tara:strand:+ start:21747 stop:23027 length:1281 start_codon:yes stop_codon:yes gene_type:complete